eukprot:1796560-Lingulodinium_polyedra.AAC.1
MPEGGEGFLVAVPHRHQLVAPLQVRVVGGLIRAAGGLAQHCGHAQRHVPQHLERFGDQGGAQRRVLAQDFHIPDVGRQAAPAREEDLGGPVQGESCEGPCAGFVAGPQR